MKGSLIGFVVAGLSIIGAASFGAIGCSSSSGGGGGGTPSGTYCQVTTGGITECTGISGGSSSDNSQFSSACTMQGGKVVSSCPTTNSIGCCTLANMGVSASTCTYCPTTITQDALKMSCMGSSGATATFTAGDTMMCSGSGGDGGSGSSSGGGDASGSSSGSSSGGGDAAAD